MDNRTIGDAVLDLVRGQVKEAAEAAVRYGLEHVAGIIELQTGDKKIPAAVLHAVSPIIAEMATVAMDGTLIDPDTGKLSKQVRAEFEARLYVTLNNGGFLGRF